MQLFGGAFTTAKGYAGGAGFDPEVETIEIAGEIVEIGDLQEVSRVRLELPAPTPTPKTQPQTRNPSPSPSPRSRARKL